VSEVSRGAAIRFIVALGLISLFADVAYEGARSVNGPYLAQLGANAAIIGIVSGAGELVGYMLRLLSGIAADRTRRYWTLTIIGYIINLAAVPALALANHWTVAAALIIAERAGKALRTPPRDVMLSQASHVVGRGWGFGLHEALDQTGAFLGPLLVAFVLKESHQYQRAYAALAIPAGCALATLFISTRFFPDPSRFERSEEESIGDGRFPRVFWLYVAGASLIAAGIVDFPLIAYHFQKTSITSPAMTPVFYAIAMGVEAIAALIFGRLFDRFGVPTLMLGVLMSAAADPLVFLGTFWFALAGMALWGAGMGALQSSLRAEIATLAPRERGGAAYGIFNTAYGLLWFAGSAVAGVLYDRSVMAVAFFAMAAQLTALPILFVVRREKA